jgi:hypothetical protein
MKAEPSKEIVEIKQISEEQIASIYELDAVMKFYKKLHQKFLKQKS